MDEYSVIGKRIPNIDSAKKVTGEAKYSADIKLPRMLYGKVLRSPHPHARILNINTEKAERLPGIKAVVTSEDTPKVKFGIIVPDEYILAVDKVRYIGDEIAAVAAIDESTAEEALQLIEVEYEVLKPVFDPIEAMQPDAPNIHEREGNIVVSTEIIRGDVEEGFKNADFIFEDRFTTQFVHQCYLEPISCTADVNSSGKITLWMPLQRPFAIRAKLSKALNIPESKIRIIQTYVGGGFGGKGISIGNLPGICALLAKKAQRPVFLSNTREEEFTGTRPRVATIIEIKTGVKKDGTLSAKEMRIIADNGAYCSSAPAIMAAIATRIDNLYKFHNIKTIANLVYTNKAATGAYRSFGNVQITFAMESQMDMISERLGFDPVDFRLKNAVKKGDVTIHGYKINSCGIHDCIQKVAESSRWFEKRKTKVYGKGIGIACMIHISGNRTLLDYDGSTAIIKMHEDGRIYLISGECDLGQGSRTILAQIAAEELGVDLDDIEVSIPDTEAVPFCMGTGASRVTTIGGNAVKAAAKDTRKQLFKAAAVRLEANPDDLDIKDHRIFVKGAPDKSLSISETVKLALFHQGGEPIIGKGSFDPDTVPADPLTRYGNISCAYPFAAQVAEVEVDTETGVVKVINFVAAHDVGRAINPLTSEGQVEGGVLQGIGWALMEEIKYKDGKVINPNFRDYKIPTSMDVPPVEVILVESNDPIGPFGAKALGEPPIVPVAPAIVNAIYDAVGIRIRDLPITPEKIIRAVKGIKSV